MYIFFFVCQSEREFSDDRNKAWTHSRSSDHLLYSARLYYRNTDRALFHHCQRLANNIPGDSLGASEGSAWICTSSRVNETVPYGIQWKEERERERIARIKSARTLNSRVDGFSQIAVGCPRATFIRGYDNGARSRPRERVTRGPCTPMISHLYFSRRYR